MRSVIITLMFLMACLLSACSSSNIVTTPEPSQPGSASDEGAQCWGDFALKFDPGTQDMEVLYNRSADVHFEITTFLNPPSCGGGGCVTATLNSWNPATFIASFNVTITNPTNLSPSDVRMVFYNLGGKKIANADSFTRCMVGSIEPFIAYSKMAANRVFPPNGAVTETIDIYWPPASSFFIFFRVSAWLWLNCQDPYEINGMYQNGAITPGGGTADIG